MVSLNIIIICIVGACIFGLFFRYLVSIPLDYLIPWVIERQNARKGLNNKNTGIVKCPKIGAEITISEKIAAWSGKNPHAIALTDKDLLRELSKSLSREQTSKCPFCKEIKCDHWTGMGWKNPGFDVKIKLEI